MIRQLFRDLYLATLALFASRKKTLSVDWQTEELSRYEAEEKLKGGLY